jgi:hypothetical protein
VRVDSLLEINDPDVLDNHEHKPSVSLKEASKTWEEDLECTVCLETVLKTKAVQAPCHSTHVFHIRCLDMWLTKSYRCPICRARIANSGVQVEGKT